MYIPLKERNLKLTVATFDKEGELIHQFQWWSREDYSNSDLILKEIKEIFGKSHNLDNVDFTIKKEFEGSTNTKLFKTNKL